MLKVSGLNVHYGLIHVVKDVSFHVPVGSIVTLIGSNGAGKTTTLQSLSNIKTITSGDILFEDESIAKWKPKRIVAKGLSQVPEGRRIFFGLSVLENLELGAYLRNDKEAIKEDLAWCFTLFPILKERKHQNAATLSGGEQQMLAMARALMSRPRLLLLDEPSMGLAPIFVQQIFSIIKEINARGTTILLVEQNAKLALSIADYGYVLENGRIVLEGEGATLLESEAVKQAYLGG
ncbi:MAG: ABC transporter ATP-binding protein [Erysipelotrichaceae bacterium]